MINAGVVHIVRKLILSIRKSFDSRPQSPLRIVLKLMHAVNQKRMIPVKGLQKPSCPYPVGSDLSLQIPLPLSGYPAVGQQKAHNILLNLSFFAYPHQRNF